MEANTIWLRQSCGHLSQTLQSLHHDVSVPNAVRHDTSRLQQPLKAYASDNIDFSKSHFLGSSNGSFLLGGSSAAAVAPNAPSQNTKDITIQLVSWLYKDCTTAQSLSDVLNQKEPHASLVGEASLVSTIS